MADLLQCHIVTVGMTEILIDSFYNRIAERSHSKFSHLIHPRYTSQDWPKDLPTENVYFFRQTVDCEMPKPDRALLASLECDGMPTIHNMILGDRVVSKLNYEEAISYSTFLASRMVEEFSEIKPSMVIGAYDGLHGSLGLAVCKYLGIPWFCKHFSVIPPGLACFCDNLLPTARVDLETDIGRDEQLARAEESLLRFEERQIQAAAYIAPQPLSIPGKLRKLPKRIAAAISTFERGRHSEYFKYTEGETNYSVQAVLLHFWRASRARNALSNTKVLAKPPEYPYVFFGLHMQPESTVDVWAPFFSNQIWVIELLARSIPPTHRLLVKIHKSDVSNYSRKKLDQIISLPGVDIVDAFADTQQFIKKSDLIVSIQGTIGLEGALYGKPVIMLGDSPNTIFQNVSRIGSITDLPALIHEKLDAPKLGRKEIVEAYASYLAPFMPACSNDWSKPKTDAEIADFVRLFDKLRIYVNANTEGN